MGSWSRTRGRFRRWLITCVVLGVVVAGSPGLWATAQEESGGSDEFGAAWTEYSQEGNIGRYDPFDEIGIPGARCANDLRDVPGFVDIRVIRPAVFAFPAYQSQLTGTRITLFQLRPGDVYELVALSDLATGRATPTSRATFPDHTFFGLPLGPTYVAAIEIYWYAADDLTIDGIVRGTIDFYRPIEIVNGATTTRDIVGACYSPKPAAVVLGSTSGTVNSRLSYDLHYFPLTATVNVRWDGGSLGTVPTDDRGEASSSFRVPAAPMGAHQIRWFTGDWTVTKSFMVTPRIKLIPGEAERGEMVNVSLRGYVARETVRIRWRRGSSWEEVARVTTSNTGSANMDVQVPSWAPDGSNSVRGDSTSGGGRAQTNAFTVVSPIVGSLGLSQTRGTVNDRVTATIRDFPPNTDVTVTFPGFYEATATGTTNGAGEATLTLRVPATPFGDYTVTAAGAGTEATAPYEVAPRIKLTPGEGAPGDTVGVSLRGYGAREAIRIRWERDGVFEEIGRVTTSGSGSANVDLPVPSWVVDGPQAVRGDEVTPNVGGRAQTNAFVVTGAEFTDASLFTPTPTPTLTPAPTSIQSATPTVESTVTAEPTATATATATVTTTAEPTQEPTSEPTIEPSATATASPTTTATLTEEPSPTTEPTEETVAE